MEALQHVEGAFGLNTIQGQNVALPGSMAELEALQKTMAAAYGTDSATFTGGSALRFESLEATLTSTTYSEQNCKFWRLVPKDKAYSTVEEYTRLTDHGADIGGFMPEGIAPEENDATLSRQAAFVKYIGTTRSVTHQMTFVKSLADAMEIQNNSGAAWIIRQINRACYWGNSKLGVAGAESVEFDGLSKQIDSGNVINAANTLVTKDHIKNAVQLVIDNYGNPNTCLTGFDTWNQFSESYLGAGQRVITPTPTNGVKAGVLLESLVTQGGEIKFEPDIFLKTSPAAPSAGVGDATKIPAAPASIAESALAGTDGAFTSTGAGVYKYKATACNRFGESAPCAISTGATFTGADLAKHVPLTITHAASGVMADYFKVYRTEPGGSITYYIASVPAADAVAGNTTTWNDVNSRIPKTTSLFIGEMNPAVLQFKLLTPLLKMDLAILAPAYRWMLLMYGVLILKAPKKWTEIKNIKLS